MAPRARIAAYKGCFGDAGCVVSDLVAAIDTAVADGVDVINYSIGSDRASGSSAPTTSPSCSQPTPACSSPTSAGNAGPGASTVGSPSAAPWVTAVGASTHGRVLPVDDRAGQRRDLRRRQCRAWRSAARTARRRRRRTASSGLDPAGRHRRDRPVRAHHRSSRASATAPAVAAAGGVGMILFDPPQSNVIPTDNHVVPTVARVSKPTRSRSRTTSRAPARRRRRRSAAATPHPTRRRRTWRCSRRGARTAAAATSSSPTSPHPASRSSPATRRRRSSARRASCSRRSRARRCRARTSPVSARCSSQAHPDWTPAMIQSALMTTGHQDVDKEDGIDAGRPVRLRWRPHRPDPGQRSRPRLRRRASSTTSPSCAATASCRPRRARTCRTSSRSIRATSTSPRSASAQLAGIQTVTRTVTNVGPAGTYTVTVDAAAGVAVDGRARRRSRSPPGRAATYAVTFTTTDGAALDAWAFGSLTWSDGTHDVRSPIAVRPVALAAPDEVSGTGTDGTTSYDVTFGYTGPFNAAVARARARPRSTTDTVVDDPANDINVALDTGVGIDVVHDLRRAGTRHLRASLVRREHRRRGRPRPVADVAVRPFSARRPRRRPWCGEPCPAGAPPARRASTA